MLDIIRWLPRVGVGGIVLVALAFHSLCAFCNLQIQHAFQDAKREPPMIVWSLGGVWIVCTGFTFGAHLKGGAFGC
jgi:hypothetical protein